MMRSFQKYQLGNILIKQVSIKEIKDTSKVISRVSY